MSKSFIILDLQGNEITLDKDKKYVKTPYGQIVEIPEGSDVDPRSLELVATQADLRLSEVNFSNILKVDTKVSLAKQQLVDRARKTFTFNTGELETDEFIKFEIPSGSSALVTRLEVDAPCTVEIYSDKNYSDSVPYTFIATEDHLIDDGRTLLSDNTSVVTKRVFSIINRDTPIDNLTYGKISNYDQNGPVDVNLIIEFIPIETIDVTNSLKIEVTYDSHIKESGDQYRYSPILDTPAGFVLGPNAYNYIPNLEDARQSTIIYLDQKVPNKFWPVDEEGGYWSSTLPEVNSSESKTSFIWNQTPRDGEYSLYLELSELPLSIAFESIDVLVRITLGNSITEYVLEVLNNQFEVGKLVDTTLKFTISGGEFVITPKITNSDIDRDSTEVG